MMRRFFLPSGELLCAGFAACLLVLVAAGSPVAAQTNNLCDEPGETPDVIVGDIVGRTRHGVIGEITAFSVGTTSCNIGTCWLNWISTTPDHPVIAQHMFRLKDGRFEQIGQSWLKHAFSAVQGSLCFTNCMPGDGSHLGVRCSDPYSSGLNGSQTRLGPKTDVNPSTGVFPYPPTSHGPSTGDAIYKRLQVHNSDLDPTLNAGARYFVEAIYVTRDDAAAGNNKNNGSFRELTVSGSAGVFDITLIGTTQRERLALEVWKDIDPTVVASSTAVPNDGSFLVYAKTTPLGGGNWRYEYAVYNYTSHRAASSFTVPIPFGAILTNVGFHDVDYHSNEPVSGTDWTATIGPTSIRWATQTFAQNPNANALRWGTLYNFRFDANAPPSPGSNLATLGVFRPGAPDEVYVQTATPMLCNNNGICEPGENCSNCPSDCRNQGGGAGCCGNGACEAGENPCRCEADCGPQTATETSCTDGIDNDCDTLTDCLDVDCCTSPACAAGDADGDTYAATCDCDDSNATCWATPGEVRNLMVSTTDGVTATLDWSPPHEPGGTLLQYDVLRTGDPRNFAGGTICLTPNPGLESAEDAEVPGTGESFYYLVRAKNACPVGVGTLGTNSVGVPRLGRPCP